MSRFETKKCDSLEEIIKTLGDENKVGKNQVWIGKNYSLKDLIQDLKKLVAA